MAIAAALLRADWHGADDISLHIDLLGRSRDESAVAGSGAEHRRFYHQWLHILLPREGVSLNHRKLFRLYRGEADREAS